MDAFIAIAEPSTFYIKTRQEGTTNIIEISFEPKGDIQQTQEFKDMLEAIDKCVSKFHDINLMYPPNLV